MSFIERAKAHGFTYEQVNRAEEAYREAITGAGMALPTWLSLSPMWHALSTLAEAGAPINSAEIYRKSIGEPAYALLTQFDYLHPKVGPAADLSDAEQGRIIAETPDEDVRQFVSAETIVWRDEAMASHWIDRYASGIDDEPQMDRILECAGTRKEPVMAEIGVVAESEVSGHVVSFPRGYDETLLALPLGTKIYAATTTSTGTAPGES